MKCYRLTLFNNLILAQDQRATVHEQVRNDLTLDNRCLHPVTRDSLGEMKAALAIFIFSLMALGSHAKPPNILLIVADDLGMCKTYE